MDLFVSFLVVFGGWCFSALKTKQKLVMSKPVIWYCVTVCNPRVAVSAAWPQERAVSAVSSRCHGGHSQEVCPLQV